MATFSKPTVVPNWATTSLNVTTPSLGERNDGWASAQIPASDIENWNKRTQGEWLEWINERFADGVDADEIVILDPDTATALVTMSDASITPNRDVTAEVNKHFFVSGTGEYKHGTKKRKIHAAVGWGGPLVTRDQSTGTIELSNQFWNIPIPVDEGERILQIDCYIDGGDTSSKVIDLLASVDADLTAPVNIATVSSTTSGVHTVSLTAINETVDATYNAYWVHIDSPDDLDLIFAIVVHYDRP